MLKQHFIVPGTGFYNPRAGDEGEISFSLNTCVGAVTSLWQCRIRSYARQAARHYVPQT